MEETMTVVAFSGTRAGMTEKQADALRYVLEQIRFATIALGDRTARDEFHHGDCIGADEQARTIAKAREFHLHCHPGFPEGDPQRAGTENDETYPVRPPLARNKEMVELADIVIAAPYSAAERLRSGTWATVRHARKTSTSLIFVYPDGSTSDEPF
jgi:hypothetical protein